MRKLLFLSLLTICSSVSFAQKKSSTKTDKKDWSKIELGNRANDHLLLQFGKENWTAVPDSIRTKSNSRHFNIYFMIDKPFKTDKRFSVGMGAGLSSSNIFFNNHYVNIKSTSTRLPFTNVDSTNRFDKFKLTQLFLEAPVELRFTANPSNPQKSWKGALGAKVGTLLKAYTKGKKFEDKNNNTINNHIQKEYDKKFFSGTRLSLMARVGYGNLSLHAAYQLTSVLKDLAGPDMKAWSVGITLSGL